MFRSVAWVRSCRITALGVVLFFFFQAEDGIRDLVRSRGLGDVYKRQGGESALVLEPDHPRSVRRD